MEGKKAIITGASYGIGRGIAYKLASLGYDLYITHLNEPELAEETADKIRLAYGRRCVVQQGDLADPDAPGRFWEGAVAAYGSIDVMINNAATHAYKPLLEMETEEIMRLVHVNYLGGLLMAQLAGRHMKEHGIAGSIVSITSSRAQRAYPVDSIYGSLKAAMARATESLALELSPYGIRVNCVAPGAIDSREVGGERQQKLGMKIPLGRMGTPADIGHAVAWLCSEEASYITGITVRVDGGLILPGMPEDVRPEAGYGWGIINR